MRGLRALGILGFLGAVGAAWASAPLQAGDLAFVGFDADGVDNIAFVVLKDIPANDTLRFCDSEWNGTGFGTDEGTFAWVSNALVPAGTVIEIDSLSSGTTVASTGSIILDSSGGLGNSDEAIFIFQGASSRAPTTMLAAIATRSTSLYQAPATSLAGSGLTVGTSAIVLPTDVDVAAYTGARTGLTAAGYLTAIANTASTWITADGAGDQDHDAIAPDVPFNTTGFTFAVAGIRSPIAPEKAPVRFVKSADAAVFDHAVDFKLADAQGKVLRNGRGASVGLKGLRQGRYFLTVAGEGTFSLVVLD